MDRRLPHAEAVLGRHYRGLHSGSVVADVEARLLAVVNLSSDGSDLLYSTYLGGSQDEQPEGPAGIAIDDTGHAYVTGATNSDDFPMVNAYQNMRATFADAVVVKLSPTADQLVFSTYLGGPNPGTPDSQLCCRNNSHAIAVDSNGSAYVAGHTSSPDFPIVNPLAAAAPSTFDQSFPAQAAFVTKFSTDFPVGNAIQGCGALCESPFVIRISNP